MGGRETVVAGLVRGVRPRMPRVSVVVPALNEARNLEVVLPALPAVHEVILVDGGSVDGTVETALRVLPGIRVVAQARRGKGNALAHGFAAATGDIVVMFDADGSADPAEISLFVNALLAGADFAKGSRFTLGGGSEDITVVRGMGNASLNALANRLFNAGFTDLCYGFNAFWADVLPVLDLPSLDVAGSGPESMIWGDGFEIETLINCRVAAAGLAITEVGSIEKRRIFGASNLRAVSDGFRVLRTLRMEHRRARVARRDRQTAFGPTVSQPTVFAQTVIRPTVTQLNAPVEHDYPRLEVQRAG